MDDSDYIQDAGQELAEHARSLPDEEVRSRSELLFPYIFEASKRMSVRAISGWLEAERGIKFSAPSVSKVLRNQESHFRQIAERTQPPAEHLAHSLGVSVADLLFDDDLPLDAIEPDLNAASEAHAYALPGMVNESRDYLVREWFTLSNEVRLRAFQHFDTQTEDDD